MKIAETIFNSTNVNRYGIVFPASVLLSCIEQCWETGLPSFVGHDHHRLLGWSRPISLFLQPKLGLLAGQVQLPESGEEAKPLLGDYQSVVHNRIEEQVGPHREVLRGKLRALLDGRENWAFPECAAVCATDLARKKFPVIFEKEDKDGLILLSELAPLAPGIFDAGDGLVLFAHQFFRRSLSRLNTLNEPFLGRFLSESAEAKQKFTARIALDPDMIGLRTTLKQTIELEYWWGPKFSDNMTNIEVGVTHHEADDRAKYFHGISATDFGWYIQKGNPTFECEEIRDTETLGAGDGKFGCRFVHSIVNPANQVPMHLDGAIRMYTETSMLARIDAGFKDAGRKTEYKKLWRVDGEIPVSTWKEFISHYYRDNHLVGEYFGGVEKEEEVELEAVEIPKPPEIRNLVPCDLTPEDGLRLSISLHQKTGSTAEVEIESFDTLTCGEHEFSYVEADTIEVVKIARRNGVQLTIPDGFHRLAYEDLVLNLPLFILRGEHSFKNLEMLTLSIKQLCEAWISRGVNKLLSFSFGVETEQFEFRVSWAGHAQAFKKFLDEKHKLFPDSVTEGKAWADDTLSFLSHLFPDVKNEPTIWRLLENSGIITLSRRILKPDEYKPHDEPDKILIVRKLHGPLKENNLSVSFITDIFKSKCSKGHEDYCACNCVKMMDDGVIQEIVEADRLALFITNRSAWQ